MTDQEKKEYEDKSYWEKVRSFNLERTPFWISILWELLETIIPWLVIWLLIGPDFANWDSSKNEYVSKSFNFFMSPTVQKWSDNGVGLVALASCMYLIWALLINTVTWWLKLQKADSFTYTMGFAFIGFLIIMNGCWMYDWKNGGSQENQGVRVIVDFIICIFGMLIGMFLGVLISTFARNYNYKVEEDDRQILIAYENGDYVPTKKQLRIERAKQDKIRREQEAAELEELKSSIDEKIEQEFIEQQQAREEEMDLTKEQKKELKKQRKAEAKKQKVFNKKNKHSDSKEIHGLD